MKVAILATGGFGQSELTDPGRALDAEGAITEIIPPEDDRVRGWDHTTWGVELDVDRALQGADPKKCDARVLPGGFMNPGALRTNRDAVAFVKSFFDTGKPVAAICHGLWMVVETGAARGAPNDLVAVAENRYSQCGSRVGR